jgi:hypothetical protein
VILILLFYPGNISLEVAMDTQDNYTVFEGNKLLFRGPLGKVVSKIKKRIGSAANSAVLIISDSTGKPIDFNFQGSEADVLKRLEVFVSHSEPKNEGGPGRPKLGVVSREVSLLPRHWEWLATQSGGASAALRKLVEDAKKKSLGGNQVKQAQERTHHFMSALAGDLKGYEEALRALYNKDEKKFLALIAEWPGDVKRYVADLAYSVFR